MAKFARLSEISMVNLSWRHWDRFAMPSSDDMAKHSIGSHWITLDYIGLHWITLDYIGLHWITLDYIGAI